MKKKVIKNDGYNILSIDLSLNGTGIINLKNGELIGKYGITSKRPSLFKNEPWATVFSLNKINEFDRLVLIRDTIANIIHNVEPNYIAIEDYSLGSNNGAIYSGEVGGIVRVLMYEMGIPFRQYEPTRLKKFVTGKGNAPKSLMCMEVYKKWGVDFTQYIELGEDLADAYGLAQMLDLELKLKENKDSIDNHPKYIQEVFTGTTKAYPTPLIDREFIKKG